METERKRRAISLTAEQAQRVCDELQRPNLIGADLRHGEHGYVELDVQARTTRSEAYAYVVEISAAGSVAYHGNVATAQAEQAASRARAAK